MAHQQIIREIKAGKFEPIYVLHGDEPFFIEDITQTLKKRVVDEASKDFNETILYGRDVELSEVLAAARRFPMMAERQRTGVFGRYLMAKTKAKEDISHGSTKPKADSVSGICALMMTPVAMITGATSTERLKRANRQNQLRLSRVEKMSFTASSTWK